LGRFLSKKTASARTRRVGRCPPDRIALCCYWHWQIESFFKLLKADIAFSRRFADRKKVGEYV
jgi:hypothetical protein